MGVGGHHADGGGPLVVLLVETLIEVWLVEEPGDEEAERLCWGNDVKNTIWCFLV